MLDSGIVQQAQSIRRNWGDEAAERYLSLYRQPEQTAIAPMPRTRWVSNTKHQPKAFTDLQAAAIRTEKSAGTDGKTIADQWGVTAGTVSSVCRRHGAYRKRPKEFTFDY